VAELGVVPKKRARGQGPLLASHDRLRDLADENTRVQELRCANDLLERLIIDANGADLRAVVDKIGLLVMNTMRQHSMYHDRMQLAMEKRDEGALSAFQHQTLSDGDKNSINHLFSASIENNRNDDKARVSQLAIVFTALTIEVDVRKQLTAQPQHVGRFDSRLTQGEDTEREDRQRANLIQRDPLVMFLKTKAQDLLTKYTQGIIDVRTYVDWCVAEYLSFKPVVDRHVALAYYKDKAGALFDDKQAKL
jgi:hypothetical protein